MPKSVRAVAVSLRWVEYSLLFPFVFVATWLEAAPPQQRENVLLATLAAMMMVAGLLGVTIIRQIYV